MKKLVVFAAAMLIILLLADLAVATTIVVDGMPGDWPSAALITTDTQYPGNPYLRSDIEQVFFSNDTTHLYFRIDTYAATEWGYTSANTLPYMEICLDVDDNTSTGALVPVCNNHAGYDFILLINSTPGGVPDPLLIYCTGPTQSDCVAWGPSAVQVASTGNVTEIGIHAAGLGISGCNTGSSCVIPAVLYSDTFMNPAYSDWVPEPNGQMILPIPGPTAVQLQQITVSNTLVSGFEVLFLVLGLFSLIILFRAYVTTKRR